MGAVDRVTPSTLVSDIYSDDFTSLVEGFIVIGESLYVWNTKEGIAFIDKWAVGTDGLIEVVYDGGYIADEPTHVYEVPDIIEFLKERM